MADDTAMREEVARRLARPLPAKHALDFYRVLGNIEGLYITLGYSRDEAEQKAVEVLYRCKPERRKRA